VTKDNKKLFVALFVDWYLRASVSAQAELFSSGFRTAMSGSAQGLLHPDELELMVAGVPTLDFGALQTCATYEGGYHAGHPTVALFWGVVHSFSTEEKQRLLHFITGCRRAPMGGLQSMPFKVQRAGAVTAQLPTSHTCFNILMLPEYGSEGNMRRMLVLAISECEGFGLQ
jgi:hypothetical protein